MSDRNTEAETAHQLYDKGPSPGLRPLTAVFTYFRIDNFNKKVDSEKGTNMIDPTRLIKFQEESPRSVYQTLSKTVLKNRTKISCFPLLDQDKLYINAEKDPQIFEFQEGNRSCNEVFNVQYFLWRILHYLTTDKQSFPTLSGWLVMLRKLETIPAVKNCVNLSTPYQCFSECFLHGISVPNIHAEPVPRSQYALC